MLASFVRQPEREAAAIVGIRLAVDQPGTDKGVYRPAHGRSAALHLGRDLVERGWFCCLNSGQQVTLLTHGLGRSGVPAQQFDQPSETRRNGAR